MKRITQHNWGGSFLLCFFDGSLVIFASLQQILHSSKHRKSCDDNDGSSFGWKNSGSLLVCTSTMHLFNTYYWWISFRLIFLSHELVFQYYLSIRRPKCNDGSPASRSLRLITSSPKYKLVCLEWFPCVSSFACKSLLMVRAVFELGNCLFGFSRHSMVCSFMMGPVVCIYLSRLSDLSFSFIFCSCV